VAYLVLSLLSEGGHLLDEVTVKALEELVDLLEGRFHKVLVLVDALIHCLEELPFEVILSFGNQA
jgi:hypothetical protein